MNHESTSSFEVSNSGAVKPRPKKTAPRHPTVVWTLVLESDEPRAPAVWTTDGEVMTERKAVLLAREYKNAGIPALALPLGREPKHLHPADKPIIVRG